MSQHPDAAFFQIVLNEGLLDVKRSLDDALSQMRDMLDTLAATSPESQNQD